MIEALRAELHRLVDQSAIWAPHRLHAAIDALLDRLPTLPELDSDFSHGDENGPEKADQGVNRLHPEAADMSTSELEPESSSDTSKNGGQAVSKPRTYRKAG